MPQPAAIKSVIQLLVEGNDQRNFFEAFTEHLSLANTQKLLVQRVLTIFRSSKNATGSASLPFSHIRE